MADRPDEGVARCLCRVKIVKGVGEQIRSSTLVFLAAGTWYQTVLVPGVAGIRNLHGDSDKIPMRKKTTKSALRNHALWQFAYPAHADGI